MRIVVATVSKKTVRSAIGMLINAQADLELVGDVTDVTDLLAQTEAQRPELVVLDWDAFGERIELLRGAFERLDNPPSIVALSVDEEARDFALSSGVVEFAYMGDPPSRLLEAIRHRRSTDPSP